MKIIKAIFEKVFGRHKADVLIPDDSNFEAVDLDIFDSMSKEELDALVDEMVEASKPIVHEASSKLDLEQQTFVMYRDKIVEARDRLIGAEITQEEVESFDPNIYDQAINAAFSDALSQMPYEIEIDGIEDPFADPIDFKPLLKDDPEDLKPEPGSDAMSFDELEWDFNKSKIEPDDFSDVEKKMVEEKEEKSSEQPSSVGDYLNSLVKQSALRSDGVANDKAALESEFSDNRDLGKVDEVHKHLFWTMATEKPVLWHPTNDLGYQETQALRLFLFRLAKTVEHRGLLLNADSFQRMAEHLKPGRVNTMLSEPWMSYRKLKKGYAIHLSRQLTEQVLDVIGFERLAVAGLPPTFAKSEEGLRSKTFSADIHNLKTLSNTLRFMNDPMANTFASSFDYVAACLGDRGAMVRVAEAIEAYVEGPSAQWLLGYLTGDLIIIADNWKRLAYSRLKDRSDGIDVFAQMFSDTVFDLRNMAGDLNNIFGDSLDYSLPSKKAKEAMEVLSSFNKKITAGVQVDWNNDFLRGVDKREPLDDTPEMVRQRPSLSDIEKSGKSKQAIILDRITNSNSDIDEAFGRLRKPLMVVEACDPDEIFNELNREFPWMEELNEYVARSVAMAERKQEGFVFKPVLLVGPAGVGKSRWARKVSEITSVPLHSANLSGVSSSKSIVGSERGWSNARPCLPGLAFEATAVANPIIYVDEVDKSSVGSSGDAIAGLLPMLEMETGQKYPDPYLLGNLDLTRISWIFTANKISGLHQEFLDRVKVITISRPSHKDHAAIVLNLVAETTKSFNFMEAGFWEGLEAIREKAMNALGGGQSIRGVKELIDDEVAKLVWKKPSHLKVVK